MNAARVATIVKNILELDDSFGREDITSEELKLWQDTIKLCREER